jgi:hypothetical protein
MPFGQQPFLHKHIQSLYTLYVSSINRYVVYLFMCNTFYCTAGIKHLRAGHCGIHNVVSAIRRLVGGSFEPRSWRLATTWHRSWRRRVDEVDEVLKFFTSSILFIYCAIHIFKSAKKVICLWKPTPSIAKLTLKLDLWLAKTQLILFFFFFFETVLLCYPYWPPTLDPSASASQVPGTTEALIPLFSIHTTSLFIFLPTVCVILINCMSLTFLNHQMAWNTHSLVSPHTLLTWVLTSTPTTLLKLLIKAPYQGEVA